MNFKYVSEIMDNRNIIVVPQHVSMAVLITLLNNRDKDVSQVYITDEKGRLNGVILLKELLLDLSPYLLFNSNDQAEDLLRVMESVELNHLIKKSFYSVLENQSLSSILESMLLSGLSVVPVVNTEKQLVGEVSCKQLLKVLPSRLEVFHHAVS